MYPDHSLMPKEALRLAALGTLCGGAMRYGELAAEVRDFTSHIIGPMIDVMGTSIELLRYEGLIEFAGDGGGKNRDQAKLQITADGRQEVETLMLSTVRTPFNDLNKLIVALKMRFFHLLGSGDQRDQVGILTDACNAELARLLELRGNHAEAGGHFLDWLDHDIGQVRARLDWFNGLKDRL